MSFNKIVVASCLALTALSASAGAVQRERRVKGIGRVGLVDKHGQALPKVKYQGTTIYIGQRGQVFQVKVTNEGPRMEAVVAVDGRDVLTGKPATKEGRGYIVNPNDSTMIKGWRTSDSTVAEFEFAKRGRGYDAQLGGEGRREGLVGVAVYGELIRPVYRPMRRLSLGRMRGGATSLGLEGSRDLSTDFGREVTDRVSYVNFTRASANPTAVLQLQYGTADGLLKAGVPKHLIDRALRLGGSDHDDEPGAFADDPPGGHDFAPYPPGYRGRGR
jgi:hypothetical protein